MSRAGFLIFPVCDLLGFLHLWITVLSVLENSQPLSLQTIPFSYLPSKTLKCMFDFVTFLSLFSKYFNLSSIFSSSFSPPKTSMDKGEYCKHGWSVSDTSNMWSLGGSVMCISAGTHSWYRVFLCIWYLLLYALWKIIVRISPDIRQRRLPLGRVYIYLCLVLRALPDTFNSSLRFHSPWLGWSLACRLSAASVSTHSGVAAGGGVRHAFLVLLSTKATLPTAFEFWEGGPVHFWFALTLQC